MPATVAAEKWQSIEPGALRHQINIQEQSTTQDSYGQPLITWTTIRTCYAGINLVSMKEVFSAGQLNAQSTDVWTMRWTPSPIVQPGMLIVFGASTYRVQVVSNPGKRRMYLHVLALELNATSGT
jgi:SPP1 family predicted phage head-tail adaptor